MNISHFTSTVFKSGNDLARDNLYSFSFTGFPKVLETQFWEGRTLTNASEVFPTADVYVKGVTYSPYSATNIPRVGDGFNHIKPVTGIGHESDLEVTFLNADDHNLFGLMDAWIMGMQGSAFVDSSLKQDTIMYYDDYISSCILKDLDRQFNTIMTTKFHDIYPLNITPKTYTSGPTSEVSDFQVNFAYRKHEILVKN